MKRYSCNYCFWCTDQPTEQLGHAFSVWHVYEEHRSVWCNVIGDRLPVDPNPNTAGGYLMLCMKTSAN